MTLDYVQPELLAKQHTSAAPQKTSELSELVYGGATTVGASQEYRQHPENMITSDGCDFLPANIDKQTGNEYTATEKDLLKLQIAQEQVIHNQRPNSVFVSAVGAVDWCNKSPQFIMEAIGLALELELPAVAFRLADTGHSLHPRSVELERAMRVLAPPRVIEANRPPKKGLSASMAWLRKHSEEYRGTWVALLAGEMIGFASSRKELVSQIGDVAGDSGVLIARIP